MKINNLTTDEGVYINEQEARKEFSKWNTVKIIEKKKPPMVANLEQQ
nr:hypothetical protein [Mycoplasmopsis bovis]